MQVDRITRRLLLGSAGLVSVTGALYAQRIRPSSASSPDNVSSVPDGALFSARVRLGRTLLSADPHHRWAAVTGGRVTGPGLEGEIEGGQVEWMVDPSGRAHDLTTRFFVRGADGRRLQVRDRLASAGRPLFGRARTSAPEVRELSGEPVRQASGLTGLLHAADLSSGWLTITAFRAV